MSRTMILALVSLGIAGAALLLARAVAAVEQAHYSVARSDGAFELRSYAPRVVAETRLDGSFEDVGNDAFRRLVG